MSTELKHRLLLAFSVICFLGIAAQGVYLWQLNQRLAEFAHNPDTKTRSIEEKILANLDDPAPSSGSWEPFRWQQPGLYDPFANFQHMQQQMDSIFGSFGIGGLPRSPGITQFSFSSQTPRIELKETEHEFEVVIAVPREHEIELNTSIEDNALSLTGTIKSASSKQQSNFASSFVSQSQFSRTIDLPKPVDEFGMSTRHTDAGIVISVPKKAV